MMIPHSIPIIAQIANFSRHAIWTSGRFILPTLDSMNEGIHQVMSQVIRTHHLRARVVGNVSIAA